MEGRSRIAIMNDIDTSKQGLINRYKQRGGCLHFETEHAHFTETK